MAVERATEDVKVTLVDGSEVVVKIYRFITLRDKTKILSSGVSGLSKGADGSIEYSADLIEMFPIIADAIWADKNYSVDDVDGNSLLEVIEQRLDRFLGQVVNARQNRNHKGSGHGAE